MMQDPWNIWETPTVEFAKAICEMNTESLEFLSKFYIILQIYSVESHLK